MNKHHLVSIGFIVFALLGIWQTASFVSVYAGVTEDVGPKLFPLIACVGIIIGGVGKLFTSPKGKQKSDFDRRGWVRIAVMFGLFFLYLLGLHAFGFLIATPIFLFAQVYFMGEKKVTLPRNLMFSVGLTACLYFVFNNLIQCILPTGNWL